MDILISNIRGSAFPNSVTNFGPYHNIMRLKMSTLNLDKSA